MQKYKIILIGFIVGVFFLVGNAISVPEPATMLLFGTGLIGLGVYGRKKLSKK